VVEAIATAAFPRANLEQIFKDFHVDGFMTKPFEIDQLTHEVGIIMQKRHGLSHLGKEFVQKEKKQLKVLVIENDPQAFDKIVISLVNGGFVVSGARTGTEGMERALTTSPHLILIKLGLSDLPGDLLASKLHQMPKTMDIPLVLYTPKTERLDHTVTKEICKKIGLNDLVEYQEPHELLNVSAQILNKNNPPSGL
jgi:DNA-binding response OmpR family regulator